MNKIVPLLKYLTTPLIVFWCLNANSQVGKDALAVDADGFIYLGVHAPNTMAYDEFNLPISKIKTNYIIKLDADGNLVGVEELDAMATTVGPLKIKGDSLFIAQSIFIPEEKAKETYVGELVFTKLHTSLSSEQTVTIPLPYLGRALDFDYANNYWYTAFAFKAVRAAETSKPKLALAGIHQSYKDGWIKQYDVRTIGQLELMKDSLIAIGSFYYNARLGGDKLTTNGVDYFITRVNPANGEAIRPKSGSTGEVFYAARFLKDENYLIAGTRLVTGEDSNSTHFFLANLNKDYSTTGAFLSNTEGIANCQTAAKNSGDVVFAAGNFSGEIQVEQTKIKSTGMQDLWVLKADKNLKLDWCKNFGSVKNDELIAMKPAPGGGVIIAYQKGNKGFANALNNFQNHTPEKGTVVLLGLDEDGAVLWEKEFSATYNN